MYRRLFPMTHEQFLEEPVEAVNWMTRIHHVYRRAGMDPVLPMPRG